MIAIIATTTSSHSLNDHRVDVFDFFDFSFLAIFYITDTDIPDYTKLLNTVYNKVLSKSYFYKVLFQLHDGLLGHFLINVAVAVEGAGVLDVAGDFGNQVRILDLFVEVAEQNAAGHVG